MIDEAEKKRRGLEFKGARNDLGRTMMEMGYLLGLRSEDPVGNFPQMMNKLEGGKKNITEAHRRLMQAYLDGYRPSDWVHPMETHAMTREAFRASRSRLKLNREEMGVMLGYTGAQVRQQIFKMESNSDNPSETRSVMPPQVRLMQAYDAGGYRPRDWPEREDDSRIAVLETEESEGN